MSKGVKLVLSGNVDIDFLTCVCKYVSLLLYWILFNVITSIKSNIDIKGNLVDFTNVFNKKCTKLFIQLYL